MTREIIPPPARDELDPSWTASTAMADRLNQADAYALQGLIIGEQASKVAQLYNQEVRKGQSLGYPVPDFDTWVRARAADRIQQGYTPLIPAPPAKPSFFRRWFGWG
jgi:hypothetical protein